MASRRMFSLRLINSTRFLKMPLSSQLLYFHLGMRADDDGVVEAFPVMRTVGCNEDDLRVLVAKGFAKVLNEDLITYITDWNENNKIRPDRKQDSLYKDLLLKIIPNVGQLPDKCQSEDGHMTDTCRQNDRIGKVRLGKDSIEQDSINVSNTKVLDCPAETGRFAEIVESWNSLSAYGIAQIKRIVDGSIRAKQLKSRISQYGEDAIIEAIDRIRRSKFLQGDNTRGWIITFDWFIKPSNFAKVYEGNYDNTAPKQADNKYTQKLVDIGEWGKQFEQQD